MAALESIVPALSESFIELYTKPGAKLSYSFIPAKGTNERPQPLIVFLNGLGLPASSWHPTISLLSQNASHPPLLIYDRYGQGKTTDRDPNDAKATDPNHPHDAISVVHDLHQLLSQIATVYNITSVLEESGLFFVCNSIGCALARLYAQTYPETVSRLLFLDSVMANSDFVSFWPNPDAPNFKENYVPLPEGITEDGLRRAIEKSRIVFHPSNGMMGKGEGLSRKNLPDLLPDSDGPKLVGTGGKGPWITVAGHDWEAMAVDSEKGLGMPQAITKTYLSPFWWKYNQGLAKLTTPERSKGPVQAKGCSHFIQKDNPEFVAKEIVELLGKQE